MNFDQGKELLGWIWGLFCLVLFLTVIALGVMLNAQYSPADVRMACSRHYGVAQIETRQFASAEAALVVCRDGSVWGVK